MFSETSFQEIALNVGIPQSIIDTIWPPKSPSPAAKLSLYSPFQLPIAYLKEGTTFELSESVINDLELNTTRYKHIFKPTHQFGSQIIKEWPKLITNDISFLQDTQMIIGDMDEFKPLYKNKDSDKNATLLCDADTFMSIWADVKENPNFLEHYHYMDWDSLVHLNKSPQFLQILSIANISSPIMSFLLPILFLVFPFLILKIQGVAITFETYIVVLQEVSRNHFIGKTLFNMQSLTCDKVIYAIIVLCMYLLQIYQNINFCSRFYKNIKTINKNLLFLKNHIANTTKKMDMFISKHNTKKTYSNFCEDVLTHCNRLKTFIEEISLITEFKADFKKCGEMGYMLKCYYEFQSNNEYDESLRFSIGFEGYLDNMIGVYNYFIAGKISFAEFDTMIYLNIEEQFYPLHSEYDDAVTNNFNLHTNAIITGPNASGKTTLLKTTAINIILSQQFGGGFYKKCQLNPYSCIYSYLNIPDTSGRDSLFESESRRCKEILDNIIDTKTRHFCIFDELYSGTNYKEATKGAIVFLSYLSKYKNVNFVLTTHYLGICKKFRTKQKNRKLVRITNYKMVVLENDNSFQYTYKITKGISKIQGAVQIFKKMGYPKEIIDAF